MTSSRPITLLSTCTQCSSPMGDLPVYLGSLGSEEALRCRGLLYQSVRLWCTFLNIISFLCCSVCWHPRSRCTWSVRHTAPLEYASAEAYRLRRWAQIMYLLVLQPFRSLLDSGLASKHTCLSSGSTRHIQTAWNANFCEAESRYLV